MGYSPWGHKELKDCMRTENATTANTGMTADRHRLSAVCVRNAVSAEDSVVTLAVHSRT